MPQFYAKSFRLQIYQTHTYLKTLPRSDTDYSQGMGLTLTKRGQSYLWNQNLKQQSLGIVNRILDLAVQSNMYRNVVLLCYGDEVCVR